MRRGVFASLGALLVVTVSAIAAATAGAVHLSAEIYGLTDGNRLVSFWAARPGEIETNVKVSGLPDGASVIGIDVRPLDGKLYTVAKVGTTGRQGQGATLATLYQVDLATGVATSLGKIGGPKTLIDIAAAP